MRGVWARAATFNFRIQLGDSYFLFHRPIFSHRLSTERAPYPFPPALFVEDGAGPAYRLFYPALGPSRNNGLLFSRFESLLALLSRVEYPSPPSRPYLRFPYCLVDSRKTRGIFGMIWPSRLLQVIFLPFFLILSFPPKLMQGQTP